MTVLETTIETVWAEFKTVVADVQDFTVCYFDNFFQIKILSFQGFM